MFAGYAFAIDYRDRRGHAYMLQDQEQTKRVTERPQPGSCVQCHASVIPTYRRLGGGDVFKGFEALGRLSYREANAEVVKTGSSNPVAGSTAASFKHVPGAHPVSCVDCHDPATMALGAGRRVVTWMVLREVCAIAAVGLAIAVPAALAAAPLIESFLFATSPNDPKALALASAILLAAALLAGYGPARRAARVDPIVALRHE